MRQSREKLIEDIERIDRILHYHSRQAAIHKRNVVHFLNSNIVTIAATLIPAFYWGWKKGLGPVTWRTMKYLGYIANMLTMTFVTRYRNQIMKSLFLK